MKIRKAHLASLCILLSSHLFAERYTKSSLQFEFDMTQEHSFVKDLIHAGAEPVYREDDPSYLEIQKIQCGSRLESSPPTKCKIYQSGKIIPVEGKDAIPIINFIYKNTFKEFNVSTGYHLRFGYLYIEHLLCFWGDKEKYKSHCALLLNRPFVI